MINASNLFLVELQYYAINYFEPYQNVLFHHMCSTQPMNISIQK